MRRTRFAAILPLLTLIGCGGGGHGSGPTAPRVLRLLVITVGVANNNFANTIEEMDLALDNKVVFTFTSPQPASLAPLVASGVSSEPGQHTLKVTMVRQSRSPTAYNFGGFTGGNDILVADGSTGQVISDIHLPSEVRTLATGQSVTYSVNIP
jgi:hypothetical protein